MDAQTLREFLFSRRETLQRLQQVTANLAGFAQSNGIIQKIRKTDSAKTPLDAAEVQLTLEGAIRSLSVALSIYTPRNTAAWAEFRRTAQESEELLAQLVALLPKKEKPKR